MVGRGGIYGEMHGDGQPIGAPTGASIVRENILTRPGYTPYCGAFHCRFDMPRTEFDGKQFKCVCGWRSGFEPEFIEKYKQRQS